MPFFLFIKIKNRSIKLSFSFFEVSFIKKCPFSHFCLFQILTFVLTIIYTSIMKTVIFFINKRTMKTNFLILCLLAIVSGSFWGCSGESYENIKPFYFPLEDLKDGGKVYEYSVLGNDSIAPVFFKYEYIPQNDKQLFVTTQFDYYCRQLMIYTDEIVRNGVLRDNVRIFEYPMDKDTVYYSDLKILAENVYPFEVKDSSQFLYKIQWKPVLDPDETLTITRKRIFAGKTVHIYKGEHLDAVDFELEEVRFGQHLMEGDVEVKSKANERYAKGVGLVYFTEVIGNTTIHYKLTNVYAMDEFTESCERMRFGDY